LAGINFRVYYRPGIQNGKTDALSRRSEYRPEKGGVENQPITTVLKESQLEKRRSQVFVASSARLTSLPAKKWNPDFIKRVRKAAERDATYQQAWESKEKEESAGQATREIEKLDDLLYRRKRLWVPAELVPQVMESEHDTKVAGHMGQDKTIELIQRNFWWPKMNE